MSEEQEAKDVLGMLEQMERIRRDAENVEAQRAKRAEQLAYDRGRESARLVSRLDAHEASLEHIGQGVADMQDQLGAMTTRLHRIERAFGEFQAVTEAVADRGVNNRTFVLGVLAVVVPVVLLFLTGAHHP